MIVPANREMLVVWSVITAAFAGGWIAGWLVSRVLGGVLRRFVRRTPSDFDDILLAAVRPHVPLWIGLFGIVIAAHATSLGATTARFLQQAAESIFILSLSVAIATFLAALIAAQLARRSGIFPATTLTLNLVRVAVIGVGALVVVGNLGIAIAPILTALGVGSLAVALALQPTLSNLFAGFHVSLARQIRVGDFIELEDGQQGHVVDIGWRSTQILELPNNLVVVPNARLAELVVKNYSLPEGQQAALVRLGVSYGSDLEQVDKVTSHVAREIQQEIDGAVPEFEPFIRYNNFGDSAVEFTVILRVRTNPDRHLAVHEFIKRLHRRYDEEGIVIPFPHRVVQLHEPERRAGEESPP